MIYLILIFQQFIASTTHIFSKNLTFDLPPTLILLFRSLFAASLFLCILLFRKQNPFLLERKELHKWLILGLLNVPLNQLLFYLSIKSTTAPNVALAYALSPIFILIISVVGLREKVNYLKVLGIVIGFLGITIILVEKGVSLKSEYFLGNLLALLASISWAFYSTYGKPMINKYGSTYSTAIAMIMGFLMYLPISLAIGDLNNVQMIKPIHWLQILYLSVMTSGVAYLLWYYALKRLPASSVGVFNNLQPVFTTILSIIFFEQTLTELYVIGGVFVLVGVTLAQTNSFGGESRTK
ncbi:MAG: DMT family transporter [Ignavibacteria bacterium]|nr:DMT family transporter [Ignavibacteria bacterium]